MGFMVPVAEHFAAYHVETDCGTEIVPVDVCGDLDESDPTFAGRAKVIHETEANVAQLRDYLESSRVFGIERREGWYARLSAPGYLDCTGWDGPHETADAALDAVKDQFDVDDNGDDLEDTCGRCGALPHEPSSDCKGD